MTLRDGLLAALVVLIWGVNFVVIHVGLLGVPPLLLGALRFTLVALPALFLVPRPAIPLGWLMAYGLTIGFGQFALLFSAMHLGMPAGLASLVLQSQMIFTLCFAALFCGERWQRHQPLALTIAAVGLLVLAINQQAGGMTMTGFVLTLGAAASWGAGNVVTRALGRFGRVDLTGLVVWSALVPPLPFLLLSLWLDGGDRVWHALSHMGWQSAGAVLYLAGMATLVGYVLWGKLLQRYPVPVVAPLTLFVPLIGLLTAAWLLDERLSPGQWAGAGLVFAGLMLNLFWPRLQQYGRRHG